MIQRIVKMHCKEDLAKDFEAAFNLVREKILEMEGCNSLELVQDIHSNGIFFTISLWDNEEALNHYRHSDLFKSTWTTVKAMFEYKAEAWSTELKFKSQ